MTYNSFQFIWLFPIVFTIYYLVLAFANRYQANHARIRIENVILLILSYVLYAQWNPVFMLILLYVTITTYYGAIIIERNSTIQNLIIILSVLAVTPLLIYKYYDFTIESLNSALKCFGITTGLTGLNLAIPLGISFFTFQALGYLLDVYHKRIKPERNLADYMLFISFFPQIASGPISKAEELLPQIKQQRIFNACKASKGLKMLLWGMFMKVVIADRLGIYVDKVYDSYMYQSGITCAFASICYSFQIYCDFAGYSLMAVGVGKVMGFDLVNNFERPYFASSITEFWKRWHISLTRWLTTHIYIGMGGNRCSKAKQYWNIIVTFLVSGLWHGANWTFIIWGLIHGLLQIIEKVLGLDPKGKNPRFGIINKIKIIRVLVTFFLVNLAWIFFRMPTLCDAFNFIFRIANNYQMKLFSPAPDTMILIFLGLAIIIAHDFMKEHKPEYSLMNNKNKIVRWTTYIVVTSFILLAGVFDASNFIYANF